MTCIIVSCLLMQCMNGTSPRQIAVQHLMSLANKDPCIIIRTLADMWNILMWLVFSSLSEAAHDPYTSYSLQINICCFTTSDSHYETKQCIMGRPFTAGQFSPLMAATVGSGKVRSWSSSSRKPLKKAPMSSLLMVCNQSVSRPLQKNLPSPVVIIPLQEDVLKRSVCSVRCAISTAACWYGKPYWCHFFTILVFILQVHWPQVYWYTGYQITHGIMVELLRYYTHTHTHTHTFLHTFLILKPMCYEKDRYSLWGFNNTRWFHCDN